MPLLVGLARRIRRGQAAARAGEDFRRPAGHVAGEIIGAFTRLACRRHPRVICAPSRLSTQQPSRLVFRSIVVPHLETLRGTPLQIGINQVHQYHLEMYCRGQLPRV